eukprot:1227809-Prymnesium_polylepis.1
MVRVFEEGRAKYVREALGPSDDGVNSPRATELCWATAGEGGEEDGELAALMARAREESRCAAACAARVPCRRRTAPG